MVTSKWVHCHSMQFEVITIPIDFPTAYWELFVNYLVGTVVFIRCVNSQKKQILKPYYEQSNNIHVQ